MNILLPFLEIRGPEGYEAAVELAKDRITVGRFRELNDVGLEPDPQLLVTRKAHCTIERDGAGWWVTDDGSVNRTFVQRGQSVSVVNGRVPITDGDIIRVLGRLTEGGEPTYWELTFRDPLKTQPADPKAAPGAAPQVEYDWVQAKLFRIDGATREEISGLRPLEHKLIRYMDQRNRANGHVPVMCKYDEIIAALWEEDVTRTERDLNHLVWELRRKIEPDPKEPQFLLNERGLGYRLVTKASS